MNNVEPILTDLFYSMMNMNSFDLLLIKNYVSHNPDLPFQTIYKNLLSLLTPTNYEISHKFETLSSVDDKLGLEYIKSISSFDMPVLVNESDSIHYSIMKDKTNVVHSCPLCLNDYGNDDFRKFVSINLRNSKYIFQTPLTMYFDSHYVLISHEHRPLSISRESVEDMGEWSKRFPSAFISVNNNMPHIGGSIPKHHHFQIGNIDLPIFKTRHKVIFSDEELKVSSLYWPVSTIKIQSKNIDCIADIYSKIKDKFESEEWNLITSNQEKNYNSFNLIMRYRNGYYELYMILRNGYLEDGNLKYDHNHKEIKDTNIGIMEVGGHFILKERKVNCDDKRLVKNLKKILREISVFKSYDLSNQMIEKLVLASL